MLIVYLVAGFHHASCLEPHCRAGGTFAMYPGELSNRPPCCERCSVRFDSSRGGSYLNFLAPIGPAQKEKLHAQMPEAHGVQKRSRGLGALFQDVGDFDA
jgi:hypothetical protein